MRILALLIEGLKKEDGSITQSTEESMEQACFFYGDLYKFEPSDITIANDFTDNLPQVPINIKEFFESQISCEELLKIIKSCKDNVSPGNDSLPIEFYKRF